ncbi:MAG TPA: hypothetical protein IAC12_07610 [Candidatus Aphodovivens avistercoris]|nr:hypothetical protein [Candidatus Aphodovivens avistercoris]
MNIAVLEGHVCNPGDLTWSALDRFGNVTVHERTPRAELRERLADADIAIANKVVWDEEALSWAPRLKLIALASTGYNVVDLNAARAHGVTVCNVPAYSTPDVAQMTFALMLGLCLHVEDHTRMVMDGDWVRANDFCFWNGSLVDEAAVADALRTGKLAGFDADVVSREPMRADNPLLSVRDRNVLITPHIAWATREARARLLDEIAKNIGAFLAGTPRNVAS